MADPTVAGVSSRPSGARGGPEDDPLTLAFLGDADSIHVRRWVTWFARRGHGVHLLVADPAAVAPGLDPSITMHAFEPYTRASLRPIGAIRAARSLRRVLGAIRPDLLHAHYLTVHGWHARLAGFHPYVVTTWGTDVFVTARETLRGRLYARLSLGAADLVTGDSADLVRAAIRAGARPDRARLVQFGVETDRFTPGDPSPGLRARLGLEGRRVLFSPRMIAPNYRQTVVVEALAGLPSDVVAVLTEMYARPAEREAVLAVADQLGVTDRLRLLDGIEHGEMPDLYRLADVVVSVPASDATPVTILEALSCGRPVVATDLPSVREWLGGLDPETLVPVDDPVATGRAIARQLDRDAASRLALGEGSRHLVRERADRERSMLEVEALYRALLRH